MSSNSSCLKILEATRPGNYWLFLRKDSVRYSMWGAVWRDWISRECWIFVKYIAVTLDFRHGICKAEIEMIWADTIRLVLPSISLFRRMSTSRLKWDRKSMPNVGLPISVMWYGHWNLRGNPKSNRRSFWPTVAIGVPFAAQSANFALLRLSLSAKRRRLNLCQREISILSFDR